MGEPDHLEWSALPASRRTRTASKSDHFDGQRFVNPNGVAGRSFREVVRMLREPRKPWPVRVETDTQPSAAPTLSRDRDALVTFVGHSTFLIQTAAGNLLTDPMYSERAGPFNRLGPRRVRPPAVPFESLPDISVVLLSHNHYDHCDLPTLRRLAARFDPLVVTPLGNGRIVRSAGIRRVEELDWWDTSEDAPMPIVLTPAQHFSARTLTDRNRALWGGFLVSAGGSQIYFAGDTAFTSVFAEIRQRFGAIDLALLPIGAYLPRWFMNVVHLDPDEAVRAHRELQAKRSIGMHFGTFQLAADGIDDAERGLEAARRAQGVDPSSFGVLRFGGSMVL